MLQPVHFNAVAGYLGYLLPIVAELMGDFADGNTVSRQAEINGVEPKKLLTLFRHAVLQLCCFLNAAAGIYGTTARCLVLSMKTFGQA